MLSTHKEPAWSKDQHPIGPKQSETAVCAQIRMFPQIDSSILVGNYRLKVY